MKKFKIEKQLKNELNKNSASDFSGVWSKCTALEGGRYEVNHSQTAVKTLDTKRLFALVLVGLLSVSFIITMLWQVFVQPTKTRFSKGYFVLDINPSIEVCYDEKGMVTSVKGFNDDGKALLVGMDFTEKTYEEATEKIFSRCLSLGYFSTTRDDNAVLVSAVTEDGEKDKTMTSALKSALLDGFSNKNLKGVVIDGVSNPLLRAEAEKYGIDAQKYGLILSYLALGGELQETEYAKLSIRELYTKIENKMTEVKASQTLQSEQVFTEFEAKLYETLAEQIGGLVETLGVYLSLEDEIQTKLNALQDAVASLMNVERQWQRKKIVKGILETLDELKALQTDLVLINLIEGAKMSINVVYQFFEGAFYQLLRLRATPEQISVARLKKFSDYGETTEKVDLKSWQQENEPRFKEDWFTLKEEWEKDRRLDL